MLYHNLCVLYFLTFFNIFFHHTVFFLLFCFSIMNIFLITFFLSSHNFCYHTFLISFFLNKLFLTISILSQIFHFHHKWFLSTTKNIHAKKMSHQKTFNTQFFTKFFFGISKFFINMFFLPHNLYSLIFYDIAFFVITTKFP